MQAPKHILITGAGSGLGQALALAYAAPGNRLSLCGRRLANLELVQKECVSRGAIVDITSLDVSNEAAVKAWVLESESRAPIDLVIANAGISAGTGSAAKRSAEAALQVNEIMAINVNGVLHTVHAATSVMQPRKRGQIAVVSSMASFLPFPGAPAYCSSKAAVRFYAEALRPVLANDGIALNIICPGYVKTPMTDVNDFPMPLMYSAERAADIVKRGLAANRALILFPWVMYAVLRVLGLLPYQVRVFLLNRMPGKDANR